MQYVLGPCSCTLNLTCCSCAYTCLFRTAGVSRNPMKRLELLWSGLAPVCAKQQHASRQLRERRRAAGAQTRRLATATRNTPGCNTRSQSQRRPSVTAPSALDAPPSIDRDLGTPACARPQRACSSVGASLGGFRIHHGAKHVPGSVQRSAATRRAVCAPLLHLRCAAELLLSCCRRVRA